jgi:hypothetical protein
MKQFLYLLVIILFAACNNVAKTDEAAVTDTALENKITAALMKLPFVTKSNNYIDSFSSHNHGIAFMMDEPQENEPDISVQVGYNGGERFETYYRFFVNPKTMEIKVYDPVEDKKLTIKEYLKTQH